MSNSIKYKDFDASAVALEGSNLIEASAGTGKTYSIAILVLRLLLEKKLAIKEILMVTFTKAAVAELEERVRYFVRSAYKVSEGKKINDEHITALVEAAIRNSGKETVHQVLRDAVLFLDETSVLTIHSFCQQTLSEFAFETNQLFGTEMVPDIKPIIEEELNKSWRKNITTLPVELLNAIWNEKMKEGLREAITQHLGGKKYLGYDDPENQNISEDRYREWTVSVGSLMKQHTGMWETLRQHVVDNKHHIIKATTDSSAKRYALPLIDSTQDFLDYLWDKYEKSAYILRSFPDLIERLQACHDCNDEYNKLIQTITSGINFLVIKDVTAGVELFKLRNNLLGYDDMIQNLHSALVGRDNPRLVKALRDKYKAVFIDEFQDTDRQQFEIFHKAFAEETILFYIGDPKQSIYAWRKADIFTYFKARSGVKELYGMNNNYRSSELFIAAMNKFFVPSTGFDTFFFSGDKDSIDYHPVESPPNNQKGSLFKDGVADVPISVFSTANKKEIDDAVAAQVGRVLFSGLYAIKDRKIKPSDIGILVRTSSEGRSIKAALAKAGIPAVTIDDSKVLQSEEARYVLYLMEAMTLPDRSSINRALLSPFTGLDTQSILLLEDEVTLRLFNGYKIRWQQDGIYSALFDFISDFGVRKVLLRQPGDLGERTMTNMLQVIELLHQAQSRKNLSMPEITSWLKRGIDGMVTEGDEYAQRIESDEDAIKIVTIHKSKGLEYNIVFAPFLDFVPRKNQDFFSFRDPVSGDYIGVEEGRSTADQRIIFAQQTEQENRRLLYVAITRAVYKCFVFKNQYYKSSTLSVFLSALDKSDTELIRFEPELPVTSHYAMGETDITEPQVKKRQVNFNLLEPNWRKMSYTMLAAKGEISPRERLVRNADPYETFILQTLRRGAKTGNLLHYIFETVNFSDKRYWDSVLEEAVRRFVPGQRDVYLPMLGLMLDQVFTTEININGVTFNLTDVDYNKRIPEFEFDFPVQEFSPDVLNDLSDDTFTINVKGFHELNTKQLEGVMNGKMDLFFEHLGRYYILDWKSNYLGPSPEDYSPASLALAMNESNYHLQYLIYTLATKKYLESRLAGFDYDSQFGGVIYLFVRGMRSGTPGGIFAVKPLLTTIKKLEEQLGG